MALILPDLTSDLSTTTGTGTYTLAGTPTNYAPFPFSALADGTTVYYLAIGVDPSTLVPNGDGAEVGLGTIGGGGTTLARTTIHRSTNSNNAVDWGAGTRLIQIVRPAAGAALVVPPSGTSGNSDGLWLIYSGSRGPKLQAAANDRIEFYDASTPSTLNMWASLFANAFVIGPANLALKADGGDRYMQLTDFPPIAYRDLRLRNVIRLSVTPSQITADQNDYAPGVGTYYRLATDASRTITGLSIGQFDGEECEIWNVGANNIVLAHQSASSTAANRFICSGAADITLAADDVALLRYDSTSSRWRVRKV